MASPSFARTDRTRLETDDAPDRTHCVARLRAVVGEAADADRLFAFLCELAAKYAASGARIDEVTLRRDFAGRARLTRSPSLRPAAQVLDRLGELLSQRTRSELTINAPDGAEPQHVAVNRNMIRDQIVQRIEQLSAAPSALVLTGEPDVGKSSSALTAAAELRERGAVVLALSLHDVHERPIDFEGALGTTVYRALGASAVAPVRVLIIDGAEAVLSGKSDVLQEVALAAMRAGLTVVAVTRSDGSRRVLEILQGVGRSVLPLARVDQFEVPGLDDRELEEVVGKCLPLRRVASNERARWLLRRLGLIDILLRADAVGALPDGALSEADIFGAVWSRWVRRGESFRPGEATPDGREAVLLELARRELFPGTEEHLVADAQAPASLRRDGLLLPFDTRSSWRTADQFSSDLVRDFALSRLLLKNGWTVLHDAGAPRWALRATRIACQARLASDRREEAREALQRDFDEIASSHGNRWGELPWEAILTAGPQGILEAAWSALARDRGAELERVLRVTIQRFVRGGVADIEVISPVVDFLCDHASNRAELPHDVRERWDTVILAWLGAFALRGKADSPHPIRQRVRDVLLTRCSERQTNELLECLALLGPDLNSRAEEVLRGLATNRGGFLEPCVETVFPPLSLSLHRPELLLALADAYYVERPRREDRWFESADPFSDGIRDHRAHGLGSPMVSWMYGPFWALLKAVPLDALSFINRMLDHAAAARVRTAPGHTVAGVSEPPAGVALELPDIGRRHCVGDDHAWSWYRGSSVGPYPCMSALLAVEKFADQALAAGISLRVLSRRLLADCNNLAMAGLVVGLLVRHIDKVTDELDQWLRVPQVWEFAFRRVMREGTLHVQGADDADLPGRGNRRATFREVASHLVARALTTGDRPRLDALRRIGDELVAQAEARITRSGAEVDAETQKWLLSVRGWASLLQAEHFQSVELAGGMTGLAYKPPPDVAEGLEPDNARLARVMPAYGY